MIDRQRKINLMIVTLTETTLRRQDEAPAADDQLPAEKTSPNPRIERRKKRKNGRKNNRRNRTKVKIDQIEIICTFHPKMGNTSFK